MKGRNLVHCAIASKRRGFTEYLGRGSGSYGLNLRTSTSCQNYPMSLGVACNGAGVACRRTRLRVARIFIKY